MNAKRPACDMIRLFDFTDCIRVDVGNNTNFYLPIPLFISIERRRVAAAARVQQSVSKFAVIGSSQKY